MSAVAVGRRRHLARVGLALLVGAVAFLAFPRTAYRVPQLTAGAVAPGDVIAPVRYLVLKDDATRSREAEALAETVKPILTVQRDAAALSAGAARDFFAGLDSAAATGGSAEAVARAAGITLSPAEVALLRPPSERRRWRDAVVRALGAAVGGYLAPGISESDLGPEVVLRERGTEHVEPAESIGTFSDFLARAGRFAPGGGPVQEQLFERLIGAFFQPTLVYQQAETERRRDVLRRTVDSVESVVLAGQRIVGAHDVVNDQEVRELDALRKALGRGPAAGADAWVRALGGLGFNTLGVLLFGLVCLMYRPEIYASDRAMAFMAAAFAVTLIAAGEVARHAGGRVELIPVALPAILLAVLFDGRIAAIAAMTLAALVGIQPGLRGTDALFVTFAGGVAAALSMSRIRSRTQVYASILAVTILYGVAALIGGAAEGAPIREIGVRAMLGGVNALASGALAMLVLPLAETFTRVTTDLRLLELGDPNRPLLRRLATEAPGTYAHSVAMANLCEAAANAIGANGLLARVGCYYHDIGKLRHPQFFVENMTHGKSPHDPLTPVQSAAIIRRHVADGLELATQHGVPAAIAAFIPEHHGTSVITYFLEQAREERNGAVKEDDFRYPGPPPRSAETAVALLGDSVEAALRVLEDPTPDTIRDAIDHLVRQRVESGQLADAPLTLRQIETIKSAFVRVLGGMYHQRLDYPEEAGGITSDWESPNAA